jgi:hypothetical protein
MAFNRGASPLDVQQSRSGGLQPPVLLVGD